MTTYAPLSEGYSPCVTISRLSVWPGNPRKTIDPAKLDELAASIREIGLQQPLVVRPALVGSGGEVVAGQRRYLACLRAGLQLVPCVVRDLTDEEALEVAIAENAARTDVSPIEEAEAIERYLDAGRLMQQAADRFGRTVAWVESRRRLLALTPAWRARVAADQCPLRHAELLSRLRPETQGKLSTRFANRELPTFLEFERAVLVELHLLSEAPFSIDDETYPGGSCHGCPSRSDRQGSLFGGNAGEDAACLDPGCWTGKVEHRWELAAKDAKKRKLRVIPTEEAGLYASGATASASAWVEVERAAGEGLKATAISRTDDGVIVELVAREDYTRAIEARKARTKAEIEAKAAERSAAKNKPEQKSEKREAEQSEQADDESALVTDHDRNRAAYAPLIATLRTALAEVDGAGQKALFECDLGGRPGLHALITEAFGLQGPWQDAVRSITNTQALDMLLVSTLCAQVKPEDLATMIEHYGWSGAAPQPAAQVDPDVARMVARFEGEIAAARSARDLGNAWRAIESEDHRASLPALAKLWTVKAETMGVSARTLAKMRKAGEAPAPELAKEAA